LSRVWVVDPIDGTKEFIEGVPQFAISIGFVVDGRPKVSVVFNPAKQPFYKAAAGEGAFLNDAPILAKPPSILQRLSKWAKRHRAAVASLIVIWLVLFASSIITVAVLILVGLMMFVVPKFKMIFEDLLKGAPLPALTQFVLGVSDFVKNNILVTIGIVVLLVISVKLFRKTKFGLRLMDRLILHAPPTGDLFLKAAIARFTRTLGTLMASGVPILQALLITRETSGNSVLSDAINVVHDRVKEGDNVAGTLEGTGVFPAMVTSMIEVGEETGALPEMLTRIADTYDDEVDNAVAGLTSIIEPVMIVFLALIVGTIVIALFLPIVRIIQLLS